MRTVKTKKKKISAKFYTFLVGFALGASLFWIPLEDFVPVHFKQNLTLTAPVDSIFLKNLPTTTPLIQREGHTLAYNGQTRNPHWVYHCLTPALFEKETDRENLDFKEDPQLPLILRNSNADFHKTGYDRGHLCPAADCDTQAALENSFFLTNISPQVPSLNRGIWKQLENHARELTNQYRMVHVFTGPLYLATKSKAGKRFVQYEVIGKNHIAVPTHFFMLIFVELPTNKMLAKAYIVPNKHHDPNISLRKFSVSVEEVEKASGVLFTHILAKGM